MAKVRFNNRAFRRILDSSGTRSAVEDAAVAIARKAQSDYLAHGHPREAGGYTQGYSASGIVEGGYGGGRPIAFVDARGIHGMRDEARNRTLLKAVAGGA